MSPLEVLKRRAKLSDGRTVKEEVHMKNDDVVVANDGLGEVPDRWELEAMGFDLLLEEAERGALPTTKVVCAIMDVGINPRLPALEGRVSPFSRGFWDGEKMSCESGHGTTIASVIANATPPNVELLLLELAPSLEELKKLDESFYSQALRYAMEHGASAINMSIDISCKAEPSYADGRKPLSFDREIRECARRGIPVVVGAGNDGDEGGFDACYHYPAASPYVLTVGAMTRTYAPWKKTNTGSCVDFFAPGAGVRVDYGRTSGEDYILSSGTSISAPCVCAAAAYVKLMSPDLSFEEVREALIGCSAEVGAADQGTRMPLISSYVANREPSANPPQAIATVLDATKSEWDEDAENLFDGDDCTKWCVKAPQGAFVEWRTRKPIAPSSIVMMTANDNATWKGRNPTEARLYARTSADGLWIQIWRLPEGAVIPDVNYRLFAFDIGGSCGPCTDFRLEISSSSQKAGGTMQLARIELR